MMSSHYVRFAKGLNTRGVLIKPEEVENHIENDKDCYLSTYYYNEEQYKRFKETNTIAGIKDVKTSKLWFDLDNAENPDNARLDAIEIVSRLNKYGIKDEQIEVYFSGGKGYEVTVQLNRELTPDQAKSIAINKFGKGLETLDETLYDSSQLLRIPYTKHQKSGLYKIPITIKVLKTSSTDDIKIMAKSLNSAPEMPETFVATPSSEFFTVKVESVKKETTKVESKLDFKDKPRHWKDYKWAIAQGHFESGERHHAILVLAATCRGLGYDREQAIALCQTAINKQAERTKTEPFDEADLIDNIIDKSVYSATWSGGQFSPQSDPWLMKYCGKMGIELDKKDKDSIIRISDIEDGFTEYVKNIDQNTVKTGIARLDKALPLTIGMNLGIVGAASSGKSSIALEILKNTSNNGVISVFASLDMHRNRMFEKLLYKVSGLAREDLYAKIDRGEAGDIIAKVKAEYGNVWFYDRSSPTVDDIRKYILDVQEQTGQKVKLVMIDYFERVTGDRTEDTAASKEIAGKLQDLINDLDVCLITFVQPNKMALNGGPDQPIKNYTAIKGSSFLYQSFRSIVSIWRPFFTPETKLDDRFMQMAILKNDLGELELFNFGWEGKRGRIFELTIEQEEELKQLLKDKERSKNVEDDDDGWK